jgi:hypothetical protein
MMNWEGFGRSGSALIIRYYHDIILEGLWKATKNLILVGSHVDISRYILSGYYFVLRYLISDEITNPNSYTMTLNQLKF